VWSLLRKDLRVFDTRDAAIFLGLYVLVGAQAAPWDEAFFWIGAGLAGALVAIVPIAEWILDTDRLVGSLPVRRATVVVARYVWAVAACAGAASVWVAGGHLLAPLLGARPTAPATWESLDGVLAFLVVTTGLAAIFLPLYFRLGLGRAALAFAPVCLFLVAASSALAASAGAMPASPGAAVREGMSAVVASAGPMPAAALTVIGIGAVLAASAWVSVRGYERRDL